MRIRWDGPRYKRRLFAGQTWGPGSVREVDAETAAQCLTHPGDAFAIDASEPLLELVAADVAALLALAGVGSVCDLARLDRAGARRVAGEVGVSTRSVGAWARKARAMVEAGLEDAPDTDAEVNQ